MLRTLLDELKSSVSTEIDTLPLLIKLFAQLRPVTRYGTHQLPALITLLQSEPDLAVGLRSALLSQFSQRHAVLLLATAGIYPATGVFSETLRRISHKLLPEVDDETQLKDGLRELLRPSDMHWLAESRLEDWQQIICLLGFDTVSTDAGNASLLADTLEALRVVAHRIAAAGLEPEMLRLDPSLENHGSPFLGVCEEALDLAKSIELQLNTSEFKAQSVGSDLAQLEVLITQARVAIARIRKRAQQQGASFHLTFHIWTPPKVQEINQ